MCVCVCVCVSVRVSYHTLRAHHALHANHALSAQYKQRMVGLETGRENQPLPQKSALQKLRKVALKR